MWVIWKYHNFTRWYYAVDGEWYMNRSMAHEFDVYPGELAEQLGANIDEVFYR